MLEQALRVRLPRLGSDLQSTSPLGARYREHTDPFGAGSRGSPPRSPRGILRGTTPLSAHGRRLWSS